MYLKAVEYPSGSNHFLAPGSEAYELYLEWKKDPNARGTKQKPTAKQKLDALLVETDKAWRRLEGRP